MTFSKQSKKWLLIERNNFADNQIYRIMYSSEEIDSKKEVLSRETYSRNPINYSEGMVNAQKDRYIQYLAE